MCCACGWIRCLPTKNRISNYRRTLIARIISGKSGHLLSPRRPWLELSRRCHYCFDRATPFAALLPIEHRIGNRDLPDLGLTGSLKRNRPNQVVALNSCLTKLVAQKSANTIKAMMKLLPSLTRAGGNSRMRNCRMTVWSCPPEKSLNRNCRTTMVSPRLPRISKHLFYRA